MEFGAASVDSAEVNKEKRCLNQESTSSYIAARVRLGTARVRFRLSCFCQKMDRLDSGLL